MHRQTPVLVLLMNCVQDLLPVTGVLRLLLGLSASIFLALGHK